MRTIAAPFALLALGAFLCATAVRADEPKGDRDTKGNADTKFAKEAACGGRAEVLLGQIAMRRAAIPAVRDFGRRMVQDHSMANRKLMDIASQKGLALPKEVDKKHQEDIDRFSQLQGPDFDRAYMKHMVKDHKHDVAAFKKEAKEGQDPALREFASKSLPLLEEHLKMAEQTERMVGAEVIPGNSR